MRTLTILLMVLMMSFSSACTGKKKKAFLLLPFMATLVGDSPTSNSTSDGAASQSAAAPSNTVTNSNSESFQVVSNGSGSGNTSASIIPTPSNNSGTSQGNQNTGSNSSGTDSSTGSTNNSSGSTGSTGSTSGSTSTGDSGTSGSNSNTSGSVTDSSSGSSTGSTSGSNTGNTSTGSNTGNTTSSGSNTGTGDSSGSSTTDNSGTGSTGGTTTPNASVTVTTGSGDFLYETTKSISVQLTVVDSNGNPLSGAIVKITDSNNQNPDGNLLFQQVTNSSGVTTGSITINTTITQVEVVVMYNGVTVTPIPVPIQVPVQTANGVITGTITSIDNVQVTVNTNSGNSKPADTDNDGVPDKDDAFPTDPTRSTIVRFPATGVYTAAFEDLFPVPGDADFNDYVVQFYNEEVHNSKGEIVEIKGKYQHVAKGAGYNHELRLRFSPLSVCKPDHDKGHGNDASGYDSDNPGSSTGINENALNNRNSKTSKSNCPSVPAFDFSYESTVTDNNGVDQKTGLVRFNPNSEQISQGLLILGNSKNTISQSNATKGQTYKPGHIASTRIVFNKPITRSVLGNAPYDLFINILSKQVSNSYPNQAPYSSLNFYEVHFPGLYKGSNGTDVYLDNSGFPWAILVPGVWAWPLEGSKYNIRGGNSPYPNFNLWTSSKGTTNKDWYLNLDSKNAFQLPDISPLMAYLKAIDSVGIGVLVGIISISLGFLFLRRSFIAA